MRETYSNNIFIGLFQKIGSYILHVWKHIKILFGEKSLPEKKEFEFLYFLLEGGPKSFWKKPTAIRLGRALFGPILYFILPRSSINSTHDNKK